MSLDSTVQAVNSVLLGKDHQVRLALVCLLAQGHLLIEDLPGMGKTTLSHALAKVLGLDYVRIQFTSDLLPADIIGSSIFRKSTEGFEFLPGPLFTQLLLADEINRSTPKTQSALLEAMEEGQVSVDGVTHRLPQPFFVIATQNPMTQSGTYALPESQLDRFLMRISIGYPDPSSEREMLLGLGSRPTINSLDQTLSHEQLLQLQSKVQEVNVADNVLDYLQRLVGYSRNSADFASGVSPRGSFALLRAARAWAFLDKRSHLIPEDIQAVLVPVVAHRLTVAPGVKAEGVSLVKQMLESVPVIV